MRKFWLLIVMAVLLIACDNGCAGIDCTSPPPTFTFQFVDTDGNDYFNQNSLSANDLTIQGNGSSTYSFNVTTVNEQTFVIINDLGWDINNLTLNFYIKNELKLDATINAYDDKNDCCVSSTIDKFELSKDYQQNSRGIYVVTID